MFRSKRGPSNRSLDLMLPCGRRPKEGALVAQAPMFVRGQHSLRWCLLSFSLQGSSLQSQLAQTNSALCCPRTFGGLRTRGQVWPGLGLSIGGSCFVVYKGIPQGNHPLQSEGSLKRRRTVLLCNQQGICKHGTHWRVQVLHFDRNIVERRKLQASQNNPI